MPVVRPTAPLSPVPIVRIEVALIRGAVRCSGEQLPILRMRLAADSVAQVQHPVALDHCVRVFEQMLGIDRPEVPLA